MATITDHERARLAHFCETRSFNVGHLRVEVAAEIRERTITIVQRVPAELLAAGDGIVRTPIAQLRYSPGSGWLLYFSEDSRWYLYCMDATDDLEAVIMELEVDGWGCFWGDADDGD